jgi:octaprenyl-diphosphate synthase
VVDALRTYGLELGTAFQIVDDVLDLVGDEAVVGKSLGTDLRNGKMTLPVIFMRDDTTPAGLALLTKVMKGEGDEADAAALRRALVEDGHVEAANVRARDHLRRGLEAVARAIPSAHADLEEIAGFVVVRAR